MYVQCLCRRKERHGRLSLPEHINLDIGTQKKEQERERERERESREKRGKRDSEKSKKASHFLKIWGRKMNGKQGRRKVNKEGLGLGK